MRNYYKLLFLILTTSVVFAQSPPQTNLKLHLRADANVTADIDTKAVSSWEDIRTNGLVATQSTGANQPHLVSSSFGINNHETISFDGTDDYLILPTPSAIGCAPYKNYDIYIVARSFSSNIQFLIAGAMEVYEIHLNGPGARYISKTQYGITYLADNGVQGEFTNEAAHVFAGRTTANGSYMRVDGNDGAKQLQTLYALDNTSLSLGRRSDASYYLAGEIAEVLIYANSGGNGESMTAQDRTILETYLATRYNITSGSLPVELTTFNAILAENKVQLTWQTATEVNNYGFQVQRSKEKVQSESEWEDIGFVEGHGTTNSPKNYEFTDSELPNSEAVSYRLKQIDNDGKFTYSNEVEVNVKLIPTEFSLEQNYPNPFNPSTTIVYEIPAFAGMTHVSLKVYDILGNEVKMLVNKNQSPGNYEVSFDASSAGGGLASGIYMYRIEAGGFATTRKMILLK